MVASAKKKGSSAASKKKKQQQQQQDIENDNNNNSNNNNHDDNDNNEIQSRDQLPVLPTRMEVRRARINEKKIKKAVKKSDGAGKKEFKQKGVVVRDDLDAIDAEALKRNPFSAGTLLAAAAKSKKLKPHSKLIAKLNAATHLKSKTETTANLSDKQREKIFVSEIQNIQKVQNNPVFQNDPLGSLQTHLQGTARMLQAPNAECRREPLDPQQQERLRRNYNSFHRGGSGGNNNNNNNNFKHRIGNFNNSNNQQGRR